MSVYLNRFAIPTEEEESSFFGRHRMTCYNTTYPYGLFRGRIPELQLEPITIFYGGNGSGKTTLLNLIAQKLGLPRTTPFNRSPFFDEYTSACTATMGEDEDGFPYEIPRESKIITSDDVFQHILRLRNKNSEIDKIRDREIQTYWQEVDQPFQLRSLDDYDHLKRNVAAKTRTCSRFVRERAAENRRERSNGESAFLYFTEAIQEDNLYLLDEPENSLSPVLQLELVQFLEASVRVGDQLIIATHSPFILSIPGAKIYDLDSEPVRAALWHQLENLRVYDHFFKKHAHLFN